MPSSGINNPRGTAREPALAMVDLVVPSLRTVAPTTLPDRIIAAEGGPGKNPNSSASGYGQFLRGTWLELFGRTYPQLVRQLSTEQILALREIRPLARELTGVYAQQNGTLLQRSGWSANDTTLSLAHTFGPFGAIRVLAAPPDQPAAALLSTAAVAANPRVTAMTAMGLRSWAASRLGAADVSPADPERLVAALPVTASPATGAPASKPLPALSPKQNFRINAHMTASQLLHANQTAIEGLRSYLEAPRDGEGSAEHGPVLVALRYVSTRPAYAQFAALAHAERLVRMSPAVLRDVAGVLVAKLEQENAAVIEVARRR